jgi:aromatic ring-opening dioxygenase LigB subunit
LLGENEAHGLTREQVMTSNSELADGAQPVRSDGCGLVFGAILPHGPDVVLELTSNAELMVQTRAAMEQAGRRFAAARIDTLILLDPELVYAQNKSATRTLFAGPGTLNIGTAAWASGALVGETPDRFECDVALAQAIVDTGRKAALPVAPATGAKDELPIVYGALIPLWFTLRPMAAARPKLVVIAPSPGVSRKELVRFGGMLAELAQESGRRVALIASADHGHTHDPNHQKFGFSPASAQYDTLYCKAVTDGRLDRLVDVSDQMLKDSWADSLWTTLILAGALKNVPLAAELLSYEAPSYYGMVVAVYEGLRP